MHLAAEDELRLRRNAVTVADLEEHLVEAWVLAAGLLFQFDRQHTGELRIGEALHRTQISGRAIAGEALNVVLSIRSGQMSYQRVDRSLFARRRCVFVGIKTWLPVAGMFVPNSIQFRN